jgi:hypothetical protein
MTPLPSGLKSMNTNPINHHICVLLPTVVLDHGFVSQDDAEEILKNYKGMEESLSYMGIGSRVPATLPLSPSIPKCPSDFSWISSISGMLIQSPGNLHTYIQQRHQASGFRKGSSNQASHMQNRNKMWTVAS